MKVSYLLFILFLIACSHKKCLEYKSAYQTYCYQFDVTEKNGIKDTLCMLYNSTNQDQLVATGYFKDGVLNGQWTYILNDKPQTIDWAKHNDKYLGFQVNLPAYVDSVIYGPNFTKFKLSTATGPITVSCFINNVIKDSLPEQNYVRLYKEELHTEGFTVEQEKAHEIAFKDKKVFIKNFGVLQAATGNKKFLQNAFSTLPSSDFIEITVVAESEDDYFARLLFETMINSFTYKGHRLYDPLQ